MTSLLGMVTGAISQNEQRAREANRVEAETTSAVEATRRKIVEDQVAEFAASIGVSCVELKPGDKTSRRFRIGDIVIIIRPHGSTVIKPSRSTKPREVAWEHRVSVLGLNIFGELQEIGTATLALLSFESLVGMINTGIGLEFLYGVGPLDIPSL